MQRRRGLDLIRAADRFSQFMHDIRYCNIVIISRRRTWKKYVWLVRVEEHGSPRNTSEDGTNGYCLQL